MREKANVEEKIHVLKSMGLADSYLQTLYFAYGSNMDDTQMSNRCQNFKFIAIGTLPDYQFTINGRGVATLVPQKNKSVHGVVWAMSSEDVKRLDRYEGVSSGLYSKENIPIVVPHFSPIEMLVYIASDNQHGKPRPGYLDGIISAAIKHGLPTGYIQELRGWLNGN